jgi:hypothetical protein
MDWVGNDPILFKIKSMLINIREEINKEIDQIIDRLQLHDPNFKQVDEHYLEVKTPFLVNPDSNNDEWKPKIGIVLYPELLSYGRGSDGYMTTPWICVRFELETKDMVIHHELCKWFVEKFKAIGLRPFMDEDATWNHFTKKENNGYITYKFYVNIDYPNGYWENHTL